MWYLKQLITNELTEINKCRFHLGRSQNAEYTFYSTIVSRQHCVLISDEDQLFVQDFKSENGVYVNNVRIESNKLIELHHLDLIGIGLPTDFSVEHGFTIIKENEDNLKTNDVISINTTNLVTESKSNKRRCDDDFITNIAKISRTNDINIVDDDDNKLESVNCNDVNGFTSDIVYEISDDDDDDDANIHNIWCDMLSQRSTKSPPPDIKPVIISSDEEENDNWWPDLSQTFLDEIESSNSINDNEKASVTDNLEKTVSTPSCSKDVQIVVDKITSSTVAKYLKPPIIDAKPLIKHSKQKAATNKINQSKSVDNKCAPESSTPVNNNLKSINNDERVKLRREKLKEITLKQKIVNDNCDTKKDKIKPKVKITNQNRHDLFINEFITNKNELKRPAKKQKNQSNKNVVRKINKTENRIDLIQSKPSTSATASLPANQVVNEQTKYKLKSALKQSNNNVSTERTIRFNLVPTIYIIDINDGSKLNKVDTIYKNTLPKNWRTRRVHLPHKCEPIETIYNFFTKWDPKWLVNNNVQQQSLTPDELMVNVRTMDLQFHTYASYYQTMTNLMLLELWEFVKKQYHTNHSLNHVFHAYIKNINNEQSNERSLAVINCTSIISKEDDKANNHPNRGDMVILQLKQKDNSEHKVFGYVTHIRKEVLDKIKHQLPIQLISTNENPEVIVHITITIQINKDFYDHQLIFVRRVGRILPMIKQFMALLKLPTSPLIHHILDPLQKITKKNYLQDFQNRKLVSNLSLNEEQKMAVFEISNLCLISSSSISIIQGPPGTGKSRVIVNIVLELLYANGRFEKGKSNRTLLPRILLCAPSNAAIDHITNMLLNFRKQLPSENRFRMVRVGQLNSMDPVVGTVSIQRLAEQQYSLRKRYKNIIDFKKFLIDRADIVCTTLGSVYTTELEQLSKQANFRFTCCIIDEATQTTEADVLLPPMLGADKLVLVGDTCQLSATVISQDAKKYGYQYSLFHRYERCLSLNSNNPKNKKSIKMLKTQYRMNPEISCFPNKFFYNNQLINSEEVMCYQFPLIPYQLFLHEHQQFCKEDNPVEAQLIRNLIVAICKILTSKINIGIITPYQKQRNVIIKLLPPNLLNIVSVNTVDSFQGQEKDVIVLSCVRTDGVGFLVEDQRLNVALTRARFALYIVGNFHSLENIDAWSALKADAKQRNKIYDMKDQLLDVYDFIPIITNKHQNNLKNN